MLYRIYGLHPVVHENLRPEKPSKVAVETADDENGGIPAEDAEDAPPLRSTRSQRTKAPKAQASGSEDAAPSSQPCTPAKKSPRIRKAKAAVTAVGMLDQEDELGPVDGGSPEKVRMEEHPEVVRAATEEAAGGS